MAKHATIAEAEGSHPAAPTASGPSSMSNAPKYKRLATKKELVEAVRKMAPAYSTALPITRFVLRNPKISPYLEEAYKAIFQSLQGDGNDEAENSLLGQLRVVESGVNVTVRRYNDLKLEADRKAKELRETLDIMSSIKVDNDALVEMKKKQNYESLRITELQELIEHVQGHIDARTHYRRQLEFMARRLDTNQVSYDAHLNSMETAVAALLKEYHQVEDLQLLLENGKVLAMNELEELEMQLHVEKQLRDKMKGWRESEYNNAAGMEDWRRERDIMQQELMAELRGDLNQNQIYRLEKKIAKAEARNKELGSSAEQATKQMNELEEVFRQLQQVTGVNSFEEMIEKFSAQKTNTQSLHDEKRQAEERLAAAKLAKGKTEQAFSSMRAQGVGCTEVNREILDTINAQVLKERMEMKINRAMNERLNTVLVDISQGAAGMSRRLHPFTPLAELDNSMHASNSISASLLSSGEVQQSNNTLKKRPKPQEQLLEESMQALMVTEAVAVKMTEIISEKESQRFGTSSSAGLDDDKSIASENSQQSEDFTLDGFSSVNKNNLRVRSQNKKKDIERLEASRDMEEGVIQADRVTDLVNDIAHIDDLVPSRTLVKLSSHRQYTEMMRKEGMAVKKQGYLERLAAADEKEKGLLQSLAARRKAQRDHASKLCVMPTLVGLPRGLTLRDDPMTKAKVFLSAMPDLS